MSLNSRTVLLIAVISTVTVAGGLLIWGVGLDTGIVDSFHGLDDSGACPSENDVQQSEPGDGGDVETLFMEVARESGLSYTADNEVISMEGRAIAGVYAVDYNRNGETDLLAIGNDTDSVTMFCNDDGRFVQSDAVPELDVNVTSALFFDHDNSGYEDLYLLSDEGSVFLENEGGRYVEREVGLEVAYDSVRGAAAADYTGDGCLDVFVVQAEDWAGVKPEGFNELGVSVDEDNGNPNKLYRGDCEYFEDVTEEAGIRGFGWSLATSFVDLTNDGYPDVHVANDFNNDVLYLNRGDGSFERQVMPEFTNRNGMSSEVADVTGNGYLDIFVTNIYEKADETDEALEYRYGGRTMGSNLLVNQGNGSFVDLAPEYGVHNASGWGWAAVLEDFDNDGNPGLFYALGDDGEPAPQPFWLGTDDGFERVPPSESGFETHLARPAAALDYDSDGGVDVALGILDGEFKLYRNNVDRGNYLQVDIRGDGSHTTIGSSVKVSHGDEVYTGYKSSGSDYLSQSSRVLHFGLGEKEEVDVRIERPDGSQQDIENVATNRRILVTPEGYRTVSP